MIKRNLQTKTIQTVKCCKRAPSRIAHTISSTPAQMRTS